MKRAILFLIFNFSSFISDTLQGRNNTWDVQYLFSVKTSVDSCSQCTIRREDSTKQLFFVDTVGSVYSWENKKKMMINEEKNSPN
jgi:hypothetical protein